MCMSKSLTDCVNIICLRNIIIRIRLEGTEQTIFVIGHFQMVDNNIIKYYFHFYEFTIMIQLAAEGNQ